MITEEKIAEYLYENLVYLCEADIICPKCGAIAKRGERTLTEYDIIALELVTQMGFKEGRRIITQEIADICSNFICSQDGENRLDSEALAKIIWRMIYTFN